jgi:protein-tyrosine phosphatase
MMAQMRGDDGDVARSRTSVLFVCTGNICRSPMAEVVLTALCRRTRLADGGSLADRVDVQSAGTAGWHTGEEMDARARAALDAAGFVDPGSPASQVTDEQLADVDVVVALDRGHRAELARRAPDRELTVLRWWSEGRDLDVPDPYFGDDDGFAEVLGMILPGCTALAESLAGGALAGARRPVGEDDET